MAHGQYHWFYTIIRIPEFIPSHPAPELIYIGNKPKLKQEGPKKKFQMDL